MARHFWVGLVIMAIAWLLNWGLDGPRTHLLFFPLWLGYVLVVDAIVLRRSGSSLLQRSKKGFVLLFVVSIPVWWLFESFNLRVANWEYVGREMFSDLEYALLASLSFSVVIPAVLETADLWKTTRLGSLRRGREIVVTRRLLLWWALAGWVMVLLVLLWPRSMYPLTWVSLLFVVEPLTYHFRRCSLLRHLEQGDWRPWIVLPLGALTCGFFWELWNYGSFPKWVYETPGFDFWYLFEMPLAGYLGYLPFGLELYPLTHLLLGRTASETIRWGQE